MRPHEHLPFPSDTQGLRIHAWQKPQFFQWHSFQSNCSFGLRSWPSSLVGDRSWPEVKSLSAGHRHPTPKIRPPGADSRCHDRSSHSIMPHRARPMHLDREVEIWNLALPQIHMLHLFLLQLGLVFFNLLAPSSWSSWSSDSTLGKRFPCLPIDIGWPVLLSRWPYKKLLKMAQTAGAVDGGYFYGFGVPNGGGQWRLMSIIFDQPITVDGGYSHSPRRWCNPIVCTQFYSNQFYMSGKSSPCFGEVYNHWPWRCAWSKLSDFFWVPSIWTPSPAVQALFWASLGIAIAPIFLPLRKTCGDDMDARYVQP